jgi:hypothetical protein
MSSPPQVTTLASPTLYFRLRPIALLCLVTLILLFALNFASPSVAAIVESLGAKFLFGLLGVVTAIGGMLLWVTMLIYTVRRSSNLPAKLSLILLLFIANIFAALCLFFTLYRSEATKLHQ